MSQMAVKTKASNINHNDLAGIGANDHIDNITDIPTRNHSDLNNIGASDHHAKANGIPSGTIAIASGSVPSGWVLCDGANATPDLRDKFVVGSGSTYAAGATGGESTHTLTESELASHNHSYNVREGNAFGSNDPPQGDQVTTTEATNNSGSDSAHENKPPYMARRYIMKT